MGVIRRWVVGFGYGRVFSMAFSQLCLGFMVYRDVSNSFGIGMKKGLLRTPTFHGA